MKGTTKILLTDLGIVTTLTAIFGERLVKNYRRKVGTPNSYLIQNVATGKVIRPYKAQIEDSNKIIQYTPENWECTTWQFIKLADHEYVLKDLYTQKSFQPLTEPQEGVALFQEPIDATKPQRWEFLEVPEASEETQYRIRLKNTDLYITPSTAEVNASLVLQKETGSDNQKWTLKQQAPVI